MSNIPKVKLGIIAVSRDCFPIDLSQRRRGAVVTALTNAGGEIYEAQTTVESELDALKALEEVNAVGVNALVIYLGNFGPEGPETMMAQRFDGPVMFAAASEEDTPVLASSRGDAYCGMLNASYNAGLRNLKVHIPEKPYGTAPEVAALIAEFEPIARVVLGVKNLKIISYGPRPQDFLACNAPIKPLYDLGVEIMENSELDMFAEYEDAADDPRIMEIAEDMAAELGHGNNMPDLLPKLAQFEVALLNSAEKNKGACKYVAFANKCWPSFERYFHFVPCYVNSRLASNLMPVSCEVDIYGALTEYMIACATEIPPTILDINNTVPDDMFSEHIDGKLGYTRDEVFMGFHCGNTPTCHLVNPQMKYQLIMARTQGEEITRGTIESDLKPGEVTLFRLQGTADAQLRSYIAHGEILPVQTNSFGGVGVFGIPNMARFYRHVLIEGRYPHHGGVAFARVGRVMFYALKMLGVDKIEYNQPASLPYPTENPFA